MYKKINNCRKNDAVSEIISVILLIAIAITVFVVLHSLILSDSGPSIQSSVTLIGKLEDDNFIIEHSRGPPLSLDTTCKVDIGGFSNSYSVGDLLSSRSKEDDLWNIGERLVYELGDITYLKVTFSIIDNKKNLILYDQLIQDGEISQYPYLVLTLNPTNIENGSAKLWLGYNFRNKSGSVRFSYKQLGSSWINMSWVPKSDSGVYNETISGLSPNKIYIYRAQLICDSNTINGEEKFILQSGLTSVNTIIPYEIPLAPTTITANGSSDLDRVTIWYRYSDDNVSWEKNWWHSSWKYRKLITIDSSKVAADLINYPMLFYESFDSDLASFAQNDGDDIVFILYSDNSTRLNHEIELFNGDTGNIVAWINLNSISSSSDTRIWMYYGNPTAINMENVQGVWDSNFVAVWHLNENPNDEITGHYDSTSNNNHGTPKNFQDGGGGSTDAVGKIGGAVLFAGDDDWIEIPHSSSLVVNGNQLALSAWVKMTALQNDDEGIIIKSDGGNYNMQLGIQGDEKGNFRVKTPTGTTYLTGSTTLQINQWYYLYGIYNGVTAKVYLNDFEDGSENRNGNIISPIAPVVLGRRELGDNRFFEGIIDEARISYTALSPEWFKTEYNNQNSPSTFYNLGNQEEYSVEWTIWNDTTNPDNFYPWSWNFDFLHGEGYYQFYSIGTYKEYEEDSPKNPDAFCLYNAPRVVDSFEYTFEFDNDKGKYPSIIHVSGDIYAIAYSGDGDDGFVKTIEILPDGNITKNVIDSYEFDNDKGKYPSIIHVSGDIYAIAYSGDGDDGFVKTFEINPSGSITQTVIDSLEFDIDKGLYPSIKQISSNVYTIVYTGDGDNGIIKTIRIDVSGDILDTILDSYEFDNDKGKYPSIIHVSGDIYAIAYSGDGDDGFVKTLNIAIDGFITPTIIDSLEFDNDKGLFPSIKQISSNVYAIVYNGDGDDGFVKTVQIDDSGDILDTILDSYEFDNDKGKYPSIIYVSGDIYAIAYSGDGDDGFVKTVIIASDGTITQNVIDTFEYDPDKALNPSIIDVSWDIFAIIYCGDSDDGFVKTIEIGSNGDIK